MNSATGVAARAVTRRPSDRARRALSSLCPMWIASSGEIISTLRKRYRILLVDNRICVVYDADTNSAAPARRAPHLPGTDRRRRRARVEYACDAPAISPPLPREAVYPLPQPARPLPHRLQHCRSAKCRGGRGRRAGRGQAEARRQGSTRAPRRGDSSARHGTPFLIRPSTWAGPWVVPLAPPSCRSSRRPSFSSYSRRI